MIHRKNSMWTGTQENKHGDLQHLKITTDSKTIYYTYEKDTNFDCYLVYSFLSCRR